VNIICINIYKSRFFELIVKKEGEEAYERINKEKYMVDIA